ncbi:MAG: hypothetical protein V1926_01125 [Candidatus Peregrinibacteria bacterium]
MDPLVHRKRVQYGVAIFAFLCMFQSLMVLRSQGLSVPQLRSQFIATETSVVNQTTRPCALQKTMGLDGTGDWTWNSCTRNACEEPYYQRLKIVCEGNDSFTLRAIDFMTEAEIRGGGRGNCKPQSWFVSQGATECAKRTKTCSYPLVCSVGSQTWVPKTVGACYSAGGVLRAGTSLDFPNGWTFTCTGEPGVITHSTCGLLMGINITYRCSNGVTGIYSVPQTPNKPLTCISHTALRAKVQDICQSCPQKPTVTDPACPGTSPLPDAGTPGGGSDKPNITLHSVSVSEGNVTVAYGKNFSDCVYLRDADAYLFTPRLFCDQGPTVTVTKSTGEIPVTVGQRVLLCLDNDLLLCSPFAVVTDSATQNPPDGDDSDADDTDPTDDTDHDTSDLYGTYLSAKEERTQAASHLAELKGEAKQERTAAVEQAKTTYLAMLEEAKNQYTADRTAAKETYGAAKTEAQEQYASAKEDAEQEYKDAIQALTDAKAAYKACRDEGGSAQDCSAERDEVTDAKETKDAALEELRSVRAEAKTEYTATVAAAKEAYTAALAEARTAYADRKQEAKDAALEARTAAQSVYDDAVAEAADAYAETKAAYDEAKAAYDAARGG